MQVNGTIPPSLGNCTNLQVINLLLHQHENQCFLCQCDNGLFFAA
jgi:hypothetical protein